MDRTAQDNLGKSAQRHQPVSDLLTHPGLSYCTRPLFFHPFRALRDLEVLLSEDFIPGYYITAPSGSDKENKLKLELLHHEFPMNIDAIKQKMFQ